MNRSYGRKTWILCCMVGALSIFLLEDVSFAKSSSSSKTEVKAILDPWVGAPEPLAYGETKHEKESKTKKGKTTIKKDKFEADVKIPIPSAALGISTTNDAASADVYLTVRRGANDIATCRLEFSGVESDDLHSTSGDDNNDDNDDNNDDNDNGNGGQLYAEFKVEVDNKNGAVRELDGGCAGIVPDAQAGDFATVEVNSTDALDGTFVQSGS